MSHVSPAVLVLEDGRRFAGEAYGAVGRRVGEAVFTTVMAGYQELLTDPACSGQILVATSPHLGNTGWNDEDAESDRIHAAGLVVRDPAPRPSNWRSRRALEDELSSQGVVGISGIDTRALAAHLREVGTMRAGISSDGLDAEALRDLVLASPAPTWDELMDAVTTREPYVVDPIGEPRATLVVLDLGLTRTSLRGLASRGVRTHVLPASASAADLRAVHPDGVFLAGGPGDPPPDAPVVATCRGVLEAGWPLLGVGSGIQVLARALGLATQALPYGHHGGNHPVRDVATGRVAITSHHHGTSVAPFTGPRETPYGAVDVSHVSLFDGTVEGLRLTRDGRVVAVAAQFLPDATAGPLAAEHLYDDFAVLLGKVA